MAEQPIEATIRGRVLTVYYEQAPDDWSQFFAEAARLYGLNPADKTIQFIACPKSCKL